MLHAERVITIDAPVEKVFSFISHASNSVKWRLLVINISLRSGEEGEVGAVYFQQIISPLGRVIKGVYTITKIEKDKLIEFAVVIGPANVFGKFEMESVGKGTKLKFSVDLPVRGLRVWLLRKRIQQLMYDEMYNFDRLKYILENT